MSEELKKEIIEFVKVFTRLSIQANLYSSNHPQVISSSNDFITRLRTLANMLSQDSIQLSFFEGKLYINNTPILSEGKVPQTIVSLFNNAHIDSIELYKTLDTSEIISFMKISSWKKDSEEFLKVNNIKNIRISRGKLIRADKSKDIDTQKTEPINFENKNFVESLKEIVSKLYPDGDTQSKVVNILLSKFKEEVERAIEQTISEIKREKIKAENDYIRAETIISTIAGSEIVIDKNGNVIMTTPDAEKITGKELKDISGKKLFDIIDIEKQVLNIAEEIKEIETEVKKTSTNIKGNQSLLSDIRSATAVIKNEEGKVVGTISVPWDVAKLKEIDQMKSDFISIVTHELRSPLTSIKMALDMISKEENLNTSTKTLLNAAVRNAERLNSIISDILDFSKLQSGKMVFNLQSVSPINVINDAISAMKAWASSKNLNLYSKVDENLPDIYADKKRTEQILINLISNAIKFTKEGGKIEVGAYTDPKYPSYVCIYVKDTGCGIKKEDITKIFEKFVQVASGEKVGGTGLGLAITKAMVVMQNGSIDVESEVGVGSTFTVRLPIYKKSQQSIEEEKNAKTKPWWKKILGI